MGSAISPPQKNRPTPHFPHFHTPSPDPAKGDRPITKKGTRETVTVDVIGENRELITVGGAKKADNLGGFGDSFRRLRDVADGIGVKAQPYLADNTPENVIELAKKKLGEDNVFIFKDPN